MQIIINNNMYNLIMFDGNWEHRTKKLCLEILLHLPIKVSNEKTV